MLKILSIDDHDIIQYGLELLLKKWRADITVLAATTQYEVLQVLQKNKVEVILMDIMMPDIDLQIIIPLLKNLYPEVKIILYSSVEDIKQIRQLLAIGAAGFVNKNEDHAILIKAILAVLDNEVFISDKIAAITIDHNNRIIYGLSPKEDLVFQLLIKGKGTKEICNITNLKPSTVSTFKNRIFVKLGVNNIVELINLAQEEKLIAH
jgi:DNA-binding NarL/FixJ family response regulator